MIQKAVMNWSGGKDSALALYYILQQGEVSVKSLVTQVTGIKHEIALHGVTDKLIEAQAKAMNLGVVLIHIPERAGNEVYLKAQQQVWHDFKNAGVDYSLFGDVFLKDIREFKEMQMGALNLKALFPLWRHSTRKLAEDFISLGFKAIVTSVNSHYLPKEMCGVKYDTHFLNSLPSNVDPCGENGEFHSFVYDGPLFQHPVEVETGILDKRGFPDPEKPGQELFFWQTELR